MPAATENATVTITDADDELVVSPSLHDSLEDWGRHVGEVSSFLQTLQLLSGKDEGDLPEIWVNAKALGALPGFTNDRPDFIKVSGHSRYERFPRRFDCPHLTSVGHQERRG
jgi:hypothetical protein